MLQIEMHTKFGLAVNGISGVCGAPCTVSSLSCASFGVSERRDRYLT